MNAAAPGALPHETCAVKLSGVMKRYSRRRRLIGRRTVTTALDDVSLELAPGRVAGLIGLNGAGKTTLLKVLATLVVPDAGTGSVFGHELVHAAGKVRAAIGYVVADERSFYWRLTGRHNLTFFGTLAGVTRPELRSRLAELTQRLALSDSILDRPVSTYSSGMRKKLALVRALLHRPRLLLMDEATRGLDPSASQRLRRLVRDELVARDGVSVLWATHDLSEIDAVCDEALLLDGGAVRSAGAVGEVLAQAREVFDAASTNDAEHGTG
jgi:ABC-2 type transport system ATP-binding protein